MCSKTPHQLQLPALLVSMDPAGSFKIVGFAIQPMPRRGNRYSTVERMRMYAMLPLATITRPKMKPARDGPSSGADHVCLASSQDVSKDQGLRRLALEIRMPGSERLGMRCTLSPNSRARHYMVYLS